jgi:hypothetical protein
MLHYTIMENMLKNLPQNMSCFENLLNNMNAYSVFLTLVTMFNEWFWMFYLYYIHSKLYHMFSQFIKNIAMSGFEWLATLVQLLTLKHEKLSISYNCYGSCWCEHTQM